LPRRARVRLAVYDVQGRERVVLVDVEMPPGWHRVGWDGRDGGGRRLAPGVYFVEARMEGDPFHLARADSVEERSAKVVILR
jgi:hypothetical protein